MSSRGGAVIWLTGLPGSGKSTIASFAEKRFRETGACVTVLDGDQLREGLNSNLGFSFEDRDENVRRTAEVARILADLGFIVFTALVSPLAGHRERASKIIGSERFLEIFVDTPIEECERRDPKGLYRLARSGEIADFTGVSSPYERPEHAHLRIATRSTTVTNAVSEIEALLKDRGHLERA